MKNFNLDRLNARKIELGESPLVLKKTSYVGPIVRDGYLVDGDGNKTGNYINKVNYG